MKHWSESFMFTKANINIVKHSLPVKKRFCCNLGRKYGESKYGRNNMVNSLSFLKQENSLEF